MTASVTDTTTEHAAKSAKKRRSERLIQTFLAATALVWMFPLLWAIYTSLRPYSETAKYGYVSIGGAYNFDNFATAWTNAELPKYYWNSAIITIPGVIFTLLLASMVAFAVSRFRWRFNLGMLMIFTAGNLLPPQVIITPLFRLYLKLPLPELLNSRGLFYDSYFGVAVIHIAFQIGFCSFVLSNYMKALPGDLSEAAFVDGASVWKQFWRIILPLSRPALAALATLEFTWIYNDFFWALVLMNTGAKRPITSALNNLQGLYFTDNNLIAAGSLLAAIPTVVVFVVLQKQFVRGLTLGSTKG